MRDRGCDMKRTALAIVVITLALLFFSVLFSRPGKYRGWQARGLLHIASRTNASFDPNFLQRQTQTISNLLSEQTYIRELASKSHVPESDFNLTSVGSLKSAGPTRGPDLIVVCYAGVDSNCVHLITANSCASVTGLYAVNQPSLRVEFLHTLLIPPKPLWRRILDDFTSMLRR